jgi:hypothetical protein
MVMKDLGRRVGRSSRVGRQRTTNQLTINEMTADPPGPSRILLTIEVDIGHARMHAGRVTTQRIRRVLKLVDQLELDQNELRILRKELDTRGECEIDLAACADATERELARTIKRRIDAAARGESRMVSMAEADRVLRERRQARGT